MQCPHCHAEIEVKWHTFALGQDPDGTWQVSTTRCPICQRIMANVCNDSGQIYPALPPSSTRPPLGEDVPANWRAEYRTACQLLPYSEEASAAVSRRLLQRFLGEFVGTTEHELAAQMIEAQAASSLPSYLKEAMDVLARLAKLTIGSDKSKHPHALLPVEPGEAEWLLELVESLLDFWFVYPARLQRRKKALEASLGGKEKSSVPPDSPRTQGQVLPEDTE